MTRTATARPILQRRLPYDLADQRPLPGIRPLPAQDWLIRDEAHDAQMARRDALLADARAQVLALAPEARAAADELLDQVLAHFWPEAGPGAAQVIRPDGRAVRIDRADPMATLGRLVQADLCILQKQGAEHVLTGAVLCFPASWCLAEKFRRPLLRIHAPVPDYRPDLARRVQRLFDGVQPGRPLWRFNALWYDDPELHQPRRESQRRAPVSGREPGYLRSERQVILRLPQSRAVVFAIHTFVIARADLDPAQQAALAPPGGAE